MLPEGVEKNYIAVAMSLDDQVCREVKENFNNMCVCLTISSNNCTLYSYITKDTFRTFVASQARSCGPSESAPWGPGSDINITLI